MDDICKLLKRSKGPVSQIVRRIRDKNIVRKVWVPGSLKDYYEVQSYIFENAFQNNFELIKKNKKISSNLIQKANKSNHKSITLILKRPHEMEEFYMLMADNFQQFLDRWNKVKIKYK